VLGCEGNVRHTVDGVDASGVDAYSIIVSLYLHRKFCSFGFSDPVALHLLHAVWSFDEFIQSLKQSICVVGDSNDSLSHWSSFYWSARSFTVSVFVQVFLCDSGLEVY